MRFGYIIEAPFNYVDADGEVTGCDVALVRHLHEVLDLGPFEPVQTEFADLLPGLADGRWQIATGMFPTPQRATTALFSRPIWALGDGLLVAAGNPLGVTGYASLGLAGGRLAVLRDQVQQQTALSLGVQPGLITVFEDYADAAGAVADGRVDAYASVARAHAGYLARRPEAPLALVEVPSAERAPDAGALSFPLDAAALRDQANAALDAYLGTPEHRAMMARFGLRATEIVSG